MNGINFNGVKVFRTTPDQNVFVVLPRDAWRDAGICNCPHCKGNAGFWDTLAIPPTGTAYTVHYPELQTRPMPRESR